MQVVPSPLSRMLDGSQESWARGLQAAAASSLHRGPGWLSHRALLMTKWDQSCKNRFGKPLKCFTNGRHGYGITISIMLWSSPKA